MTLKRIGNDGTVKESVLISESGGYSDICFSPETGMAFIAFENSSGNIMMAKIQV
mgnify:CR=1 FL=1